MLKCHEIFVTYGTFEKFTLSIKVCNDLSGGKKFVLSIWQKKEKIE